MHKMAWLLAGAGAKGIVQAGMILGLLEQGYTYDILFGASAGALNGAILHQNEQAAPTALTNLWMTVKSKDVRTFAPWKAFTSDACIYDNAPLAKLINRLVNPGSIRINPKPYGFSVTDLTTWTSQVFLASELSDSQMKQLLRISASPPLLTPLEKYGLHGDIMTDGGMANDFGITWAKDAQVLVVFMPTVPKPPKVRNIIDVIDSTLEVALYCYLKREMEATNRKVIVIQPEKPLDISVLDFDYKHDRKDLINYGKSLSRKVIPQIEAAL